MPPEFGPDDVRLMLSCPLRVEGGGREVHIEAAHADTGAPLFRARLTGDQFAALMFYEEIITRSKLPVPRGAAVQHPPVRWLEVTLTATTNQYLSLPCQGRLQVTEYSADGHVIHAIFRRYGDNGAMCAPVEVGRPQFTYGGRYPSPAPLPCPDPAAHEPDCANQNHTDLGDCDGKVQEYLVTGTLVAGYSCGETVPLCASHAQFHGRHIRRPMHGPVHPAVQP